MMELIADLVMVAYALCGVVIFLGIAALFLKWTVEALGIGHRYPDDSTDTRPFHSGGERFIVRNLPRPRTILGQIAASEDSSIRDEMGEE